uniref:Uncharacterized protein n=1 Tax=Candidatus Kentrum sp. MB TaxID=2138164 RepID=A0A450XVU2_9GAMM|nr:MAG: hypothetical protein BECKMB1821G_GA0114241_10438 [Candidatus Kentron sp. MB]VFK33409.1 MAG: hypothetical protein BECKMB1821I_GA0114274_10458 [Candidatus Kentron sp. MB]VFK76151.1 MAG: hypothetical protein BECKMB1821H_GA0114242_10448 [Candidatus Kentron sp. MB]
MILPSKHLSQDRALLTIGARILQSLDHPKTVSAVWEEFTTQTREESYTIPLICYDYFVLALDLLFLMGAIELRNGLLHRKNT